MNKAALINIEEIEKSLHHPDPEIRMRAIKDLISFQNPRHITLLEQTAAQEADVQIKYQLKKGITFLKNIEKMRKDTQQGFDFSQNLKKVESALLSEHPEQVNKAFRYIAQYRLRQFLPAMEKIAADSGQSYQKSTLITFMVNLGGEMHFNKITSFLNDSDPRVVSTAIEALESIGNTKALAFITQFTTHEHHRVQAAAMKALVKLGDQNALSLFEKMVRSPHEIYRSSAAYALKELRIEKGIPLLEILAEDESENVRNKALEALNQMGWQPDTQNEEISEESVPQDAPVKEEEEDLLTQWQAMNRDEKMEWIRTGHESMELEEYKYCLQFFLKEESEPRILASLIMAAAHSCKDMDPSAIKDLLSHSDDRVRANAVEALGVLLHSSDKDSLLPCLEDLNNRVVGNTILALIDLFPDECNQALRTLAESPNRNEQLTAVFCIGALANENTLQLSDYLSESSFGDVREKMLSVLEDLSQESSEAMKILNQHKLRMASFTEPEQKQKSSEQESSIELKPLGSNLGQTKPQKEKPAQPRPKSEPACKKAAIDTTPAKTPNTDFSFLYKELSGQLYLGATGLLFLVNLFYVFVSDPGFFYNTVASPFKTVVIIEPVATLLWLALPFITLGWLFFSHFQELKSAPFYMSFLITSFFLVWFPGFTILSLPGAAFFNPFTAGISTYYLQHYSFYYRLFCIAAPILITPIFFSVESIIRFHWTGKIAACTTITLTLLCTGGAISLNNQSVRHLEYRKTANLISHYQQQVNEFSRLLKLNKNLQLAQEAAIKNSASEAEEAKNKREMFKLSNRQFQLQEGINKLQGQIERLKRNIPDEFEF